MDFQSEALKLIAECGDCTLTSVSEDGFPRTCFMGIMGYDSFSEVYISTGYEGTKVRHFKANNKASLAYRKDGDSVTLVGTVEFITDRAQKERFWFDWMYDHFPNGVDDENYCLIKFTGKVATYWIQNQFLRDDPIK